MSLGDLGSDEKSQAEPLSIRCGRTTHERLKQPLQCRLGRAIFVWLAFTRVR